LRRSIVDALDWADIARVVVRERKMFVLHGIDVSVRRALSERAALELGAANHRIAFWGPWSDQHGLNAMYIWPRGTECEGLEVHIGA
jgi:hypothetical protein